VVDLTASAWLNLSSSGGDEGGRVLQLVESPWHEVGKCAQSIFGIRAARLKVHVRATCGAKGRQVENALAVDHAPVNAHAHLRAELSRQAYKSMRGPKAKTQGIHRVDRLAKSLKICIELYIDI
jgi:hypothetical protein